MTSERKSRPGVVHIPPPSNDDANEWEDFIKYCLTGRHPKLTTTKATTTKKTADQNITAWAHKTKTKEKTYVNNKRKR